MSYFADDELELPIRLIPRRRPATISAIAWLALAACCFLLLKYQVSPPANLRAVAILIIGAVALGGLVQLLKLLPRSPFFHLRLTSEGVWIRRFFHRERYAWHELSSFSTINSDFYLWRRRFLVIAFWAHQLAMAERGRERAEIAVKIDTNPYGTGLQQQDAIDLAEWLTELRERASLNILKENDRLSIPAAFRKTVIMEKPRRDKTPSSADSRPGKRRRLETKHTPTVVRH